MPIKQLNRVWCSNCKEWELHERFYPNWEEQLDEYYSDQFQPLNKSQNETKKDPTQNCSQPPQNT